MAFDLGQSIERAQKRLGTEPARRPRRDRGQTRLPTDLAGELTRLLQGQERPPVRSITRHLDAYCAERGLATPARATIYEAMARTPTRSYVIAELPPAVRETLYNLSPTGTVPGHQLAFQCLNYGGPAAMSYAAGLPWLALYQAARMPGWHRGSRGLIEAIRRVRRI